MQADLDANLQLVVRRRWFVCRLKQVEKSGMCHQREVCRFTGRLIHDILMKNTIEVKFKKKQIKGVDP